MSKILYVGFGKPLNKVEYNKEEIFPRLEYPNSLYAQSGILFDNKLNGASNLRIGKYLSLCNWYEIKGMILPFECKSTTVNIMPDLYEASRAISEWFIDFLKKQTDNGNQAYLLQRWLGDKENKKTANKTLPLNSLCSIDCELPYDVLIQLK